MPSGRAGYARTATHGRIRSVHTRIHGSGPPRNSYVRNPRRAAYRTVSHNSSWPGEQRANAGS